MMLVKPQKQKKKAKNKAKPKQTYESDLADLDELNDLASLSSEKLDKPESVNQNDWDELTQRLAKLNDATVTTTNNQNAIKEESNANDNNNQIENTEILQNENNTNTDNNENIINNSETQNESKNEEKTEIELKNEEKEIEKQYTESQLLERYGAEINDIGTIWCEVANTQEKYLHFIQLYDNTPKEMTLNYLFENSLLNSVDKDYLINKYMYGKPRDDKTDAFSLKLWTADEKFQFKPKMPSKYVKLYYKNSKNQKYINNIELYAYLNGSLVNDDGKLLEPCMPLIRSINNIICNYPTTQEYIVYRGSKMNKKDFDNKYKIGDKKRISMYLACSKSKRIAKLFMSKYKVLVTIYIPKGCLNARVVPASESCFPGENEVLIPPYSLFTCIGKKETHDLREIILELALDNKQEKFAGIKNIPYWKG